MSYEEKPEKASLWELGEEARKKTIENLERTPLTLEEIMKSKPFLEIIGMEGLENAIDKASIRVSKWIKKKGKNLTLPSFKKLANRYLELAVVQETVRVILGYYGEKTGQINYYSFANRLYKALNKQRYTALLRTIQGLIGYWKTTFGVDAKILHVIALAVAKGVRYVRENYKDFYTRFLYSEEDVEKIARKIEQEEKKE